MNHPRHVDADETDRVINFGMRQLLPGRAYVVLYTSNSDESGCDIRIASNLEPRNVQDLLTNVTQQLGLLNNSDNN